MNSTRIDGNHNNNSEMEDEFDNCADDKVCLYETVISGGFINRQLYGTNNKLRSVHNNDVTIKDENIDDQTVVGFINENPSDMQYKQGSIHNYVTIKNENIDELITNYTDDMACLNETVISRGYIKQEPCGMKDEEGNIQNYFGTKDENLDDLTVVAQETELVADYIDSKVCVHETIISREYIKEEPCDTRNELGSIYNNVDMKGCSECGEKYDLYCLKCPMLVRIYDSNDPDSTDTVMRTLPKNFVDICKTQFGIGIVAVRAIPKGVVFGPFKGLDLIEDEAISKWRLKNKEVDVIKDGEGLNWMKYIRKADKSSHQNLVPFQYEDGLYYRSECHLNVGDELLVHWDSDSNESEINDMEDRYWEPPVCESLDDSYACTFCCVGYKSISHLKAHNCTCIGKRNTKDFCKDIVQCDICKIYLDKKEYSDYHMDRCYKSDGKCVFSSRHRRKCGRPLHYGDRPFSCTLCPYEATTKSILQRHIAVHNDDRPFACPLCPYKARTNWRLKEHSVCHSGNKPFACILCPYRTKIKSSLKQHIALHNNDKPFVCTLCPYKAKTKWSLKNHIASHNGDKPFACTLCPYKAKTNWSLKQHIGIHKDDKPFACTLCPYKAKTNWSLNQHIAIHKDDKPFACTLCPYKTKKNSYLKKHIASHSSNKPFACTFCPYKGMTESNLKRHTGIHNGDKPFACTLCPYKTTRKSFLKQHIVVHVDDKPFACTLCPYKAKKKWSLNNHIASHNDDKPFACTFCPYKTKTSSNLKRHIVVHVDDKPFACTLCPYKAKKKWSLNDHIASHNDDKPFACTLCPHKTTRKSYLKIHMAVHNDDKPFACTICPYKATRKARLKKHIAIQHGDKP